MDQKKRYFITLNPAEMEITNVRDDSQLVQYEVEATEDEIQQIKKALERTDFQLDQVSNVMYRHFDEGNAMEDGHEFQHNIKGIFDLIYQYGTETTKEGLESLGLIQTLEEEDKRNYHPERYT
ncbi:hypothetical protein [Texcoconibacillus texcoconensis]|uniref:Septal ring factor EnvC (AmiA/AmiB activator) n=1 Tax=Texcoconibacillus texcoconensis TaxID=1095777 RepID=A0A840QQW8_9BACI|nr:hypothetical protein [Texcoconibacillus texcoconensis]MBB5173750.1 septal ring factor EnvC (AmiA/AmiB activator) [Texcoconibacillus texcoconensis]